MRKKKKKTLIDLVIEALQIDGEHHKQWYLERILEELGCDVDAMRNPPYWEEGIAP